MIRQQNIVILQGNLVDDMKVHKFTEGVSTYFRLANTRQNAIRDSKDVHSVETYMDCEIRGERGAKIAEHAKKGRNVTVHGRLAPNNGEGKDGKKYYGDKIIVDEFFFGPEPRSKGEPDGSGQPVLGEDPPF